MGTIHNYKFSKAILSIPGNTMNNKMNAGIVVAVIAAISTFGVIDSLQAAPKESQRLRGMEGRAFLVESVALAGPPAAPGSYCYFFNPGAEWIDERFSLDGVTPIPGTWEQHSVGAATSYTATASVDATVIGLGLVELVQDGHVTPAQGKGVLQLQATTEVYIEVLGPDPFQILSTVGHEIDADDCPPPFPPPEV